MPAFLFKGFETEIFMITQITKWITQIRIK